MIDGRCKVIHISHVLWAAPPRLVRSPRPGPCLNFGLQYALIRNNQSKKIGVEYWAFPGSNLPWRPCWVDADEDKTVFSDDLIMPLEH